MAKILPFPTQPAKIGFTRVRKRPSAHPDQMNLFAPTSGRILQFVPAGGLFDQALSWDDNQDFAKAEELYRKAIDEGDSVADAYCNLGIIESLKDQASKAFDCFTQSLTLEPRHCEAHYNLGNLYFDLGDFKLAKVHYRLAAEIQPDFPNVYFNLGLVLAITEQYREAIDALSRYQELVSPEDGAKAEELLGNLRRSLELSPS